MKKGIRIALSMLLVFGVLAVLPFESKAAELTKKTTEREIAIVFDNSGSMYMRGNKAWCQATYAMEVFASMMNEGDTLKIYPMSEVEVDGKVYSSENPLVISDPSGASTIRKIYTPKGGDTFVSTIDAAYNDLLKSKADEQWLIVLTDGEVFYEPDDKALTAEETRTRLSEVLSDYSSRVRTLYLGIGSVAAVPEIAGKYANAPQTADSAEVPEKLSAMCNTIFGRDALPEENQSGSSVTFDIPLSKLIVFAQGEAITGVDLENNKAAATLSPKASELGAGNYAGKFGTAPELQGIISTYEALPAGTYGLSYEGRPEAVSVYYEPDADLRVELLDSDGNSVLNGGDLYSGDYTIKYAITDSDGNDISESALLGNTEYAIDIKHNGTNLELPSKDKAGEIPITLVAGDTLEVGEATVKFLKDYTITKTGEELGFPAGGLQIQKPKNTLKLTVSGGESAYQMSELEDKGIYQVTATYNGQELSTEDFSKVKIDVSAVSGGEGEGNPALTSKQGKTDVVLGLQYHEDAAHTNIGDQKFTVKASYTDQYGDTATDTVEVPFSIAENKKVLMAAVSTAEEYYLLKKLGADTPVLVSVTMDGKPLTDEEMDLIATGGTLSITAPAGLSVSSEVIPIYGTSTFSIPLEKEGSKKGNHKVSCTVSMPDSKNLVYEAANATGTVKVAAIAKWLLWLFIILGILLLALLIFLILNKGILPRKIESDRSQSQFKSNGTKVPAERVADYTELNIFQRLFDKDATLRIGSPDDIQGDNIQPIQLTVYPTVKIKDILSGPGSCRVGVKLNDPGNKEIKKVLLDSAVYKYDQKTEQLVDAQKNPSAETMTEIADGSLVKINASLKNGVKTLEYKTMLNIKW